MTAITPASTADIVIIGSGIGGSTIAAGLAASGAEIIILEAGEALPDIAQNRDQKAIFQDGFFRPDELWYQRDGSSFNPGNYYNVGGNSKFYGAVLARYRAEDFALMQHREGVSPAWPFDYQELEPWYSRAEQLFQVRGSLGEDPTEPPHQSGYPFAAVPDEPAIAVIRRRLQHNGLHPYSLPLGIDIERWLQKSQSPWDAHPHCDDGKMDAQTTALAAALHYRNVRLQTGARVTRLLTDAAGNRIQTVCYQQGGQSHQISARLVILSAGAVQSSALLLRSANQQHPRGLANQSDQVGRNFMNHNASAVLAFSPRYKNNSVYQKTFGFNDFYLSDGAGGLPLGSVQLLGRVSGQILKASLPYLPLWLLNRISAHTIDFYAMSEDIPNPQSRITVEGERIILNWQRSNWQTHLELVKKLKTVLQAAGFPLVVSRAFDKRTPSHQCGTVRMGTDPAAAPLDPYCRSYDHPNLFVVDASFFPSSAAVNPALTIAAQALRVAAHICVKE